MPTSHDRPPMITPSQMEENSRFVQIGRDIVSETHDMALRGESFEDAESALDKVEKLQAFRKKIAKMPFGNFLALFEDATNIGQSSLSRAEKELRMEDMLMRASQKAGLYSPRVADLFLAILAEMTGEPYETRFPMTREYLEEQRPDQDIDTLFSGDVSWDIKLNRIEKRLLGYLKGARDFDKREGKLMSDDIRTLSDEERKKSLEQDSDHPPSRRNWSKPSLDEMRRLKEGEHAKSHWRIFPALGHKYFREQAFSVWDSKTNTWMESTYTYTDPVLIQLCEHEDPKDSKKMNAKMRCVCVAGEWVSVPLPYTHGIHKIDAGKHRYKLQQDQNGDYVMMVDGRSGESVEVEVTIAPFLRRTFGPHDSKRIKVPDMPAKFLQETEEAIRTVSEKRGAIPRAYMCAKHTQQCLRYSNNSSLNSVYENHPDGYIAAIDEYREADCDVGNTYFAALCARLRIPIRHVVGHSVKGKDEQGASHIHSGTSHAWSEVWDEQTRSWVRIDATPPGDPNLQEDQDTSGESGDLPLGDFVTQYAVSPTEEALECLRAKLAKMKKLLSYNKEERYLANMAGIELSEARQIVKEIALAEDTRMPRGEKVVDVLARLFHAIVETRKNLVYTCDTGPITKKEGGKEISKIVKHVIGVRAGNLDPVSRARIKEEEEVEQLFGGFDVFVVADKSGSMTMQTEEGDALLLMQRRAEYLLLSALHRFDQSAKHAGIQQQGAISIRTQSTSFRDEGEDAIDLDKPLSSDFKPQDQVRLWHSLTKQGCGNGDVTALSMLYTQISKEIQEEERRGIKDRRLRLIICFSDGGPVDPVGVRELAEKLGELGVVVVGIGLTDSAQNVPIIYNTPNSRGDIVRNVQDLPLVVAKHVIQEAIRLFPKKAEENAKRMLKNFLQKFKDL